MKPHSALLLACVITAAAGVTPVFAQEGGLFGRTSSNPNGRQKLDVTVSSTGEYDVDSGASTGLDGGRLSSPDGSLQAPGYSAMLESAMDYGFRGRRAQVRMNGASAQRYSRPLDNLLPSTFSNVSQSGDLKFAAGTRRTTVSASQTGVYSSSPLYGLFTSSTATAAPGAAPAAPPSYVINDLKGYSYETTIGLMRRVTQRTGVAGSVEWQRSEQSSATSGRQILEMYDGSIRLSHGVARDVTITTGYVYRVGEVHQRAITSTTRRLQEQGVEFGYDQRRRVAGTRTLTFGAVLGISAMRVPPTTNATTVEEMGYNRIWGQTNLGYEFARGWQTRLSYRQGVDYVPALSEPILARSVTASLNGQMTRRLDVLTSAAYSSGQTIVTVAKSAFDTYTGDARLRFAVARTLATYVEYLYYFYDSRGTSPLVPGVPPRFERNTIRVGLMLRIPAI